MLSRHQIFWTLFLMTKLHWVHRTYYQRLLQIYFVVMAWRSCSAFMAEHYNSGPYHFPPLLLPPSPTNFGFASTRKLVLSFQRTACASSFDRQCWRSFSSFFPSSWRKLKPLSYIHPWPCWLTAGLRFNQEYRNWPAAQPGLCRWTFLEAQ